MTSCSDESRVRHTRNVASELIEYAGKIAAQCGHATLACYKAFLRSDPNHPLLKRWEHLGQAKVALKVDSEDEMLMLQATAVSLGLCAKVIHDAGRTQIASGSATVLGIGPAPKSESRWTAFHAACTAVVSVYPDYEISITNANARGRQDRRGHRTSQAVVKSSTPDKEITSPAKER